MSGSSRFVRATLLGLVVTGVALFGPVSAALGSAQDDVLPPPTPRNVQVIDVTDSSVRLVWDRSTDPDWDTTIDREPFIGYWVYEGARQVGFTLDESFDMTDLAHQTTFSFTIEAYDRQDNRSPRSETVRATTLRDVTAPPAPLTVTANLRMPLVTTLGWQSVSTAIDYVVSDGTRTQVVPQPLGWGLLSAQMQTPTPGTYPFTVRARDAAGNLSEPARLTLVVEHEPPTTPLNLRQVSGTVDHPAIVAWDAASDNSTEPLKYDIFVGGFQIASVEQLSVDVQVALALRDLSGRPVPPGTYALTVRAHDASGNLSNSSSPLRIVIP